MALLLVNPRYQDWLLRQGLAGVGDFLNLPGVVVSGHPDRHVMRVCLDDTTCYLKREHRVRRRDRWAAAWHGFGLVSKSCREFFLLQSLHPLQVLCPEPLAAGEDRHGRAFLLVRELAGVEPLTAVLRRQHDESERRQLALELGRTLARIHELGFDHPDLYAKHVLLGPDGFAFLDWQRSQHRLAVGWGERCRDLAALEATLSGHLARPRERLFCLLAYLRHASDARLPRLSRAARDVRRQAARLMGKRRIREQRLGVTAAAEQTLVWLDGEALCVSPAFAEECRGQIPRAVVLPKRPEPAPFVTRDLLPLPGGRQAQRVRRSARQPFRWLWSLVSRRALAAPELEGSVLLFRLQRHGVATPRLLAFGQKRFLPWQSESFLLIEPAAGTLPLADWLRTRRVAPRQRWDVLHAAAGILRRMHEADVCLRHDADAVAKALTVTDEADELEVLLGDPAAVCRRRARPAAVRADLAALLRLLPLSRSERLHFVLAYLELRRTREAGTRRRWIGRLLR
jgi:tRNA A-37 threonylcarbamoyl transferase component Bud32